TGVMVPWTYGGMNVNAMDAHGGWIATASDLVKLILAVDNFPSKPDILTPATIATMITPSPRNANYAKGWQVNSANNWWHSGSLPGSFSIMARTSGEYAWAIIMNKRFNTGQFANAVDALPWNSIAGVTTWPTYDLALAPTLNATNLSFSEVTSSTMKVSWANGNGANRLLIVRPDAPVNAFPLDGVDYTGVTNFSTAPALPGSTVKVVYSGTGNSATITGLEPGKTYHVRVVEYNKSQSTGNNAL